MVKRVISTVCLRVYAVLAVKRLKIKRLVVIALRAASAALTS